MFLPKTSFHLTGHGILKNNARIYQQNLYLRRNVNHFILIVYRILICTESTNGTRFMTFGSMMKTQKDNQILIFLRHL